MRRTTTALRLGILASRSQQSCVWHPNADSPERCSMRAAGPARTLASVTGHDGTLYVRCFSDDGPDTGPTAGLVGSVRDPAPSRRRSRGGVLVLVVAAPPRGRKLEAVLVTAFRRPVEQLVGAIQDVEAACVGRVGVVDDAVLARKGAQPGRLLAGVGDPAEGVRATVWR